jgi:hypothetical protein
MNNYDKMYKTDLLSKMLVDSTKSCASGSHGKNSNKMTPSSAKSK